MKHSMKYIVYRKICIIISLVLQNIEQIFVRYSSEFR